MASGHFTLLFVDGHFSDLWSEILDNYKDQVLYFLHPDSCAFLIFLQVFCAEKFAGKNLC